MKSRSQKREEGARRNAIWAGLTRTEKLADLDRRLGKGQGARRQRRLLQEAK